MYADDETHPISSVDRLDVVGARRAGGADLILIVSGPLSADERSQRRLLRKVENYLGFILSDEFGEPSPEKARIVVKIDPASHPVVLDLLKRCEPWVLENNAGFVIENAEGRPGA